MTLPPDVQRRVNGFVTLTLYYRWSHALQQQALPFMNAIAERKEIAREELWAGSALGSYWFASLCVLTEGWRKLRLADARIDGLLNNGHVETLRRFRNGLFHFQANIDDARFDFQQDVDAIVWAIALGDAYEAFLSPHVPDIQTTLVARWVFTGGN